MRMLKNAGGNENDFISWQLVNNIFTIHLTKTLFELKKIR